MASLLSKSLQGWCTDHHHAKSPSLAPRLQLHYPHLHDHTLKASNTSSSRGSSSTGPPRPQPSSAGNASISPARFLHTLEFTAIAIAAVGQAAILVSTAVCQWRQTQQLAELQDQLTAVEGSLVEAGAVAQGGMQLQRQQQLPVMQMQVPAMPMVPAHTSLHLITGSALVVGLLCGAGLRQLQMRHPSHPHGPQLLKPSADAAVRLAALEVASQQTAAQLSTTARQMDKLQARVRLATSDLKQPLRAAQGSAAQQAAALLKLAEQQAMLQKQVDGSQELIAALQGLAAKQFMVSTEALQQLKQGQSQLSGSTSNALKELQQQQQKLHKQIQAQQQLLQLLQRQQAALPQRQQPQQEHQQPSPDGSASSSSGGATHPDPWHPTPAVDPQCISPAPQGSPGGNSVSTSQGGNSSSRSGSNKAAGRSSAGRPATPSNGHQSGSTSLTAELNGASPAATAPQ